MLTTHVHPYKDDFNTTLKFRPTKPLLDYSDNDFSLEFVPIKQDAKVTEKGNKHVETFGLKERYASYKSQVQRIKKIADKYPETRIRQLMTELPGIVRSREEIIKDIAEDYDFPSTNEVARNMQCGKLKKDIAEEFGLL